MTIGGTACADRSLVYLNNRYDDPTLDVFVRSPSLAAGACRESG